jgi:hypothetical protein
MIRLLIEFLDELVLVDFFNTSWYPILQGRLYSNLPGPIALFIGLPRRNTTPES